MSADLYTGGSPPVDNTGVRFRSEMTIVLYSDGSLSYYNGSYPWCRTLGPGELEAVLEDLRILSQEAPEKGIPGEQLMQGATLVQVSYDHSGSVGEPFRHAVTWASTLESAPATVRALDRLFCSLEASLGSGYRHQITTHFGEFMSARQRSQPCEE